MSLGTPYLHLSQYEGQGKGLRGQILESGLSWGWETLQTHFCHIEYGLSIAKWTASGPGVERGG